MKRKLLPFIIGSALAILAAAPAFRLHRTSARQGREDQHHRSERDRLEKRGRAKSSSANSNKRTAACAIPSFIKHASKKYEVGVDAKDGRVLENKVEGKNPD